MQKRGQLTIFVIVAIVVVAAIISIIYLMNQKTSSGQDDEYWQQADVKQRVNVIKDYLQDCVDSTTKEGLILIAFQGGYYEPPMRRFDYSPTFFPYYYYEGQINMPSLERIESELAKYAGDTMIKCVEDGDYERFDMEYTDPRTDVKITEGNVYFQIDMQIELSEDGHYYSTNTREYSKNYNSSLYEIYEVAEYITNSHKEDPEYYCISCVSEMAHERGLYVYLYPSIANQLITGVMIYENRTGIAEPYTFIFFNKYTGEEKTPKLNT